MAWGKSSVLFNSKEALTSILSSRFQLKWWPRALSQAEETTPGKRENETCPLERRGAQGLLASSVLRRESTPSEP